jgi:hypothetical protein
MILILGLSQYMQGYALHKHRTFYIAISSCIYGWRTVKDSLHPIYFEGNMSAEFLRDLVGSCKRKSQCKKSCVCAEHNLAPDRKHANLWYEMRHEKCADEAPLLKVVI